MIAALMLFQSHCMGETIDRVVAFVDDIAITHRELERQYAKDISRFPSRNRNETLEAMINTALMLKDARRLHLWADNDTDLLQKYLDLKIRAIVYVSDRDVAEYYKENRGAFGGRVLEEAKPEIRHFLEELHFNRALKEHIAGLRVSAIIVVLDGRPSG